MLRRVHDLPARFPSNIEGPAMVKKRQEEKKQTNCGDIEILNKTFMCETHFFFFPRLFCEEKAEVLKPEGT